jgi:uncharacterized membrane protein YphA (DoxX/SURF4 family)
MSLLAVVSVLTGIAFIVYGVQCLVSTRMREEFSRYGFPQLRQLTGGLEILAGLGLLVGLRWAPVLTVASGILLIMMIGALLIRIRIKDGIVRSLPALVLVALNGFIFFESLK